MAVLDPSKYGSKYTLEASTLADDEMIDSSESSSFPLWQQVLRFFLPWNSRTAPLASSLRAEAINPEPRLYVDGSRVLDDSSSSSMVASELSS